MASISSIFPGCTVGIGVVSNRILTRVNDRLCEMAIHRRNSWEKPPGSCIPLMRIMILSEGKKYRCGRRTVKVETRWKRKDGSLRDILLSSTQVDISNPTKNVTFTAALDITDRKQAEEKLRAALEQLSVNEEKYSTV